MQLGLDRVDFRADDRDVGALRWRKGQRPHPGVELGVISAVVGCVVATVLLIALAGGVLLAHDPSLLSLQTVLGSLVFTVVMVGAVLVIAGLPASIAGAMLGRLLWNRRIGVVEVLAVFAASLAVAVLVGALVGDPFGRDLLAVALFSSFGSVASLAFFVRRRRTWRGGVSLGS